MSGRRELVVEGGAHLRGLVVAPPDKSITHRALFLAALGAGECVVEPLGLGRDNRATLGALAALGVEVESDGVRARIVGVGGPKGLRAPAGPIDCMNSGTTMRLLAGILAASRLTVRLEGDASLTARPMTRLLPLESMGAKLEGQSSNGRIYPPLTITGGDLAGRAHVLPVASAQVKSALLLAGVFASDASTIAEPRRSRDHTERMLRRLGARVEEMAAADPNGSGRAPVLRVEPLVAPWSAPRIEVAPDLSSAAFFLVAAALAGSDDVVVETGTNPTRSGVLDVLERMGVLLERIPVAERGGEPVERIRVLGSRSELVGATIAGELTLRAIDEVPLLAGLAAFARGTTVIRDAGELRVKESDRLAAIDEVIRAFGGTSTPTPDGLTITGHREALRGAVVDGRGDHRIAMTAAVMGLGVPGATRVAGAEHIEVSFPRFEAELARLGARVRASDLEGAGEG